MKALLLPEYKKLEYVDFDDPPILDDEVLVRVKACGICGSDIHGYDGSTGRRIPPVIMGHEASGEIVEVGRTVSNWKIGDRVTFDSTIYCNECAYCRRGLINLCDNRRVLGVSCDEYLQHGAFAEYVAIPQQILTRIPDGVSYDKAAMVEPISIAFHAVNLSPIHLGNTVVVVGAGMIGLLVIQALRLAGCGQIIAIDIDPSKFDLAYHFGADECLMSHPDNVRQRVFELTEGQGASVSYDVVGLSSSLEVALAAVKKGGQITLVGNFKPTVDLPLQKVVNRQITLQGSCASNGEYPAVLNMLARGSIQVDPIISAVAPLSDGAAWFERLYSGDSALMKVILRP
jgi:L-iditol 2-dehydrogenase